MDINSRDLRHSYVTAETALAKQGVDLKKAKLMQSYLQFVVVLNQNDNVYEFPILQNQQSNANNGFQYPIEKRIKLQDAFYVSDISFSFRSWSAPDNTTTPTAIVPDPMRYMPFYSPSFFFDPNISASRMMLLWNGWLKILVENDTYVDQWPLENHLAINQTQFPEVNGSIPVNTPYNGFDQKNGGTDGKWPMEPNWCLIGSKSNNLYLNLPEPFGTSAWDNPTYRVLLAVVRLDGVLAQNSTSVH